MIIRILTYAGSVLVTCGAAWAATDPPPIDQLAVQLERALDLLERGGPAVIGLELVLGVGFLAALGAIVLVLITAVQAIPRSARPIADAYATMFGGATRREQHLQGENAALRRDLETFRAHLRALEDRDEEKSRIIAALFDQLAGLGMDVSGLRAMATHATGDAALEQATAA